MIMNKKTRALTEEQYRKIITTINEGFVTAAGERVKPNSRIATALTLEANSVVSFQLFENQNCLGEHELYPSEEINWSVPNHLILNEV